MKNHEKKKKMKEREKTGNKMDRKNKQKNEPPEKKKVLDSAPLVQCSVGWSVLVGGCAPCMN